MTATMTIKDLQRMGYTLHHIASQRGYLSRKDPRDIVEPYKGRFGTGYKVLSPRWDTTQYVKVEYWTK